MSSRHTRRPQSPVDAALSPLMASACDWPSRFRDRVPSSHPLPLAPGSLLRRRVTSATCAYLALPALIPFSRQVPPFACRSPSKHTRSQHHTDARWDEGEDTKALYACIAGACVHACSNVRTCCQLTIACGTDLRRPGLAVELLHGARGKTFGWTVRGRQSLPQGGREGRAQETLAGAAAVVKVELGDRTADAARSARPGNLRSFAWSRSKSCRL